jgi:hypothetical protein
VELNRKAKGDIAELKIAADLRARGYKLAFPYGEDVDFDLILCRDNGALERVQVKYARSNGRVIIVQVPFAFPHQRQGEDDEVLHRRSDRLGWSLGRHRGPMLLHTGIGARCGNQQAVAAASTCTERPAPRDPIS